jgi:hypothetical protein
LSPPASEPTSKALVSLSDISPVQDSMSSLLRELPANQAVNPFAQLARSPLLLAVPRLLMSWQHNIVKHVEGLPLRL